MAHLTLQEVIDRVNHNYFHYSKRELRGARNHAENQPHHPDYYVPRITRFLAGFMFGAFRAASQMPTVQKANGPHLVA
jgi:hypothetical protein